MGWGIEIPCSQARPGKGFAAQHNFFSFYLYEILGLKRKEREKKDVCEERSEIYDYSG